MPHQPHDTSSTPNETPAHDTALRELELGIVGGMRTPLAVLRASLEALAFRFEPRDPRAAQLASAITQVARIQHNLQTVLDAERPLAPRPLPCTLQEIVHGAVAPLVGEHKERTLVAVEHGDTRVVVDGPLVSRSLTRLVEAALDAAPGPVLVRAGVREGRASIVLVRTRDRSDGASARTACDLDALHALVARVARRDVERSGGTYTHGADAASPTIEIAFTPAVAREEAA